MSPNCSSPETVCLQCGDKGFTNAFVYCVKCLKFAVHRYCLNVIPKSVDEFVRWFCDDCEMEVLNHPTTCRNDAIQSKTRDRTPSKHILGTSGVAAKKFVILALDIEQRVNKGDPCRSIDACAKPESIECAQSADKSSCSGSHLEPGTVLHSITSCNGPFESSKKKKTNLSSEANFEERKQQRVSEDGNRNREQEVSEDRTSASHHESDFHRGFSKDSTNDCIVRAEPLMEPIWSGSFNIWNKKDDILEGLMAHVSSRACRKVHEEACQFHPVIHLEMLPKSNVWPKSLNTSEQSAGNIALYFFPSDTRSERVFDYLVNEMVENELALKAIVQNAELLVFTSTELPLPCWRFQGKYYLWGVFREKQHKALRSKSCNREQRYNTIMHKDGAGYTDSSEDYCMMSFNPLMIILNQNKLTGPNYLDWKRNLDIVLVADEYKFVLTTPAPAPLGPDSTEEQKEAHRKWHKANEMARCYILASMSNVLQQQHQSMPNAADIMLSLKELFGEIDRAARFEAIRKIMSTSMPEGASVRDHGLKMIEYLNEIEVLGGQINGETKIDMILNSLPRSFENFRLNVIMSRKDYTVAELLTELVAADGLMGRTPQANVSVQAGPSSSKGGKKKKPSQKKGGGNSGSKKVAPSGGVKKPKGRCFKCNKTGHWKTDCPLLKKDNSGVPANKAAE